MKEAHEMKSIPVCCLPKPAECPYKVDGKLSHFDLCGGNDLDEEVKACPNRKILHVQWPGI